MSDINYILQCRPIRVALVNDNGIIIKVFRSQTDAAICTETDQSAISKICRGLKDSIKGKKFKSISDKLYNKLKLYDDDN